MFIKRKDLIRKVIRRRKIIMEEYLTAKQVAEYLQVKPLTIYQWAREEKIPAIKIGRIWRFKKDVIDAFLEEQLHSRNDKA